MKYIKHILFIAILACLPSLGFSTTGNLYSDDERSSLQLKINGEKFLVQNLPSDGIVEVFNILGSKVLSFNTRDGVNVNRINLPAGYYILKSENITRKIVVK
ncbi:MAG: hypothetical protein RL662_2522 [Bacteroidota bacterium]|jgi:hypothetical protein